MLPSSGGCLCGALRYRLGAEPVMVAVCHCRTCQRNTGSAFSTNLALPAAAFAIEGDTLATYETRASPGAAPFLRSFCGRCGSPVFARGDAYPGIVFVKVGTLDEPAAASPTMHMWCDERLPWVRTADDVPCLPAGPQG